MGKYNIFNLVTNSDLQTKFPNLATEAKLKSAQDGIMKLQAFDLTYFQGTGQIDDDGI